MEWWSNGVMCFKTQYSSIPTFQHSNSSPAAVATLGRNGLEVGVTGGSFYGRRTEGF